MSILSESEHRELDHACQNNEYSTFSAIIYRHYAQVTQIIKCKIKKHHDLADDVLQESVLIFWKYRNQPRAIEVGRLNYFVKVLKTEALKVCKAYASEHEKCVASNPGHNSDETAEFFNLPGMVDELHNNVDRLKEPDQTIVRLRFLINPPLKIYEIANRLELKPSRVSETINKAVHQIQLAFKEKGYRIEPLHVIIFLKMQNASPESIEMSQDILQSYSRGEFSPEYLFRENNNPLIRGSIMKALALFLSIIFTMVMAPLGLFPSCCCPPHPSLPPSPSQSPSLSPCNKWAAAYGNSYEDAVRGLIEDVEGYTLFGFNSATSSNTGRNAWVAQIDNTGELIQNKEFTLSANNDDTFSKAVKCPDGGYVAVGSTYSYGAGSSDALIVKFANDLSIQWAQAIGGANAEGFETVRITNDGAILAAGSGIGFGPGGVDIFAIKMSQVGAILWQRCYGVGSWESFGDVIELSNGDLLFCGGTEGSSSGPDYDGLIMRTDSSGNILWQNKFDGSQIEIMNSVAEMPDGSIIVVGNTQSSGAGSIDCLVSRLSSNGSVLWQETIGGSVIDSALSVVVTSEETFVICGYTRSYGSGSNDGLLMQLDIYGAILWQRAYGSSASDIFRYVTRLSDGALAIQGTTASFGALGESDGFAMVCSSDGLFNGTTPPWVLNTAFTPASSAILYTPTNLSSATTSFNTLSLNLSTNQNTSNFIRIYP